MTTIAIDLDDSDLDDLVRYLEGDHHMGVYDRQKVVGQLKAAADKRVIVLDVDELEISEEDTAALHYVADEGGGPEDRVLRAVAHRLDGITPPRPPEPTGLGSVVRDGKGLRWVRLQTAPGQTAWAPDEGGPHHRYCDIPDPIEVLSEGVTR